MSSLATLQRSLRDESLTYPLWPVLWGGCPYTSTERVQYPLDIDYDYNNLDPHIFDQPPLPGLTWWSPLLPPLVSDLSYGEGGTPLIPLPKFTQRIGFEGELWLKDETRNPTWSHKDRLNLCAVSAAVKSGADGIVVGSSGNHGASAAAYAVRAGLKCIFLLSDDATPTVKSFARAYGTIVIMVPREVRLSLMNEIVQKLGYHPVSNITHIPTGHPFGPEGYKTIAYEIWLQLGKRTPSAVFIPTGYAELLFGVWKGFRELRQFGLIEQLPQMVACEPAVRAPLTQALATGHNIVEVEAKPTEAYSIAVTINSYRGIVAIKQSNGYTVTVYDTQMVEAKKELRMNGLWVELSCAASLAGFREALYQKRQFDGPIVCIATSSGFKDRGVGQHGIPEADDWETLRQVLKRHYDLTT